MESAPHPRHKLTPELVKEIRANTTEKPEAIARRLGVNERTIRKVKAGLTWKTGKVDTGMATRAANRAARALQPEDRT